MAKKFGTVDSSLWRHPKFKGLSDDAKFLFMYLKTCDHQNIIGCFYLPKMYACADTGWGIDRVSIGFHNLIEEGFIKYCDDTETVFLVKHMELHPIQGHKQLKGAINKFNEVNNNASFISDLAASMLSCDYWEHKDVEGYRKGFDTLSNKVSVSVTPTVSVTVSEEEDLPPDCDTNQDLENSEEPPKSAAAPAGVFMPGDDPNRFQMFADWEPTTTEDQLKLLYHRGMTDKNFQDQLNAYRLAKLESHGDHRSQHAWSQAFIRTLNTFCNKNMTKSGGQDAKFDAGAEIAGRLLRSQ